MKLIFTLTVMALFAVVANGEQPFYYGSDGPVYLGVDSNRVLIKPTGPAPDIGEIVYAIPEVVSALEDDHVIDGFYACSLQNVTNYDLLIDELNNLTNVDFAEPYFRLSNDSAMLVGDKFFAAFYDNIPQGFIDSVNTANHVEIVRVMDGTSDIFLLRNTPESGRRILEQANTYYDLAETEFAHPNFTCPLVKSSTYELFDWYHDEQPHLKKVIGRFNVASVWDFAKTTENIVVAVIDDGIVSHEDLPSARIRPGRDFNANSQFPAIDDDPSPGYEVAHGMACAGIIGASHTTDSVGMYDENTGIISMDPHVDILPVKIFNDDGNGANLTDDHLFDAMTYAWKQGADVLSCSWGWGTHYFDLPILDTAIWNAVDSGRGGLGCVVVFSSGNSGPGQAVQYPARLPEVLAVGAIDLNDEIFQYSQFGNALDLVAPSGLTAHRGDVFTLDQMGMAGFNPNDQNPKYPIPWAFCDLDYDCYFGGTSAAAPVVSGAAALVLSYDGALTYPQAHEILKYSAVTEMEFDTINPPDYYYGYGRVDAFRAVLSLARGDCNNDGAVDNSDVTKLVNHLFVTYEHLFPTDLLGDVNCDGDIDIQDMTRLVNHLFVTFEPLAIPCYNYDNADW